MKLDKFLCFMFLFAFLALTLHKTRQKHAFFSRITNQKLRLIYSKLTCEPKTKDCAGSRTVQHLIATVLFLLLKFPGFHNQSLDELWHNRLETRVSRDAQNVCAITIVGTVLNLNKNKGSVRPARACSILVDFFAVLTLTTT